MVKETHLGFFDRNDKREVVDESLGLRVVSEGDYIRVFVGDRNSLFIGATPQQFLQYYRESYAVIHLNFGATSHNQRALEFSPREQDELRRDIALHWIRYYLSTGQLVQVMPADLSHPQTWSIVLNKAESKYGSRSADAMWLAAHTVGSSLQQFETWRRVEDDRLDNM